MKTYSNDIFPEQQFPLEIKYDRQMLQMPPHNHDFLEIVFVAQGITIHKLYDHNRREFVCGLIPGDLFSILPQEIHSYTQSRDLRLYNIIVGEKFLQDLPKEIYQLKCFNILFTGQSKDKQRHLHLRPFMREKAIRHLQRIISVLTLHRQECYLEAKTAFLEFILAIESSSLPPWNFSNQHIPTKFLDSLEMLESDIKQRTTLSHLASSAGMSVASYTRYFREVTGLSPMSYRIGIRIDIARHLLLTTNLTLSEISWETGFTDSNYLIKQFKKYEGMTPRQFRYLHNISPSSHT